MVYKTNIIISDDLLKDLHKKSLNADKIIINRLSILLSKKIIKKSEIRHEEIKNSNHVFEHIVHCFTNHEYKEILQMLYKIKHYSSNESIA